jgi:hypothetical protein
MAADLPIAANDAGPIDYIRERDVENEPERRSQWRSYLIRLLAWWPDE